MTAATATPSIERRTATGSATRLVAAEILKLRKRRGLFWSTLALTVGPMVAGYGFLAVRHQIDPDRYAPAGGLENLQGSFELLSLLTLVLAIIVGVTVASGDLRAGVFRELVVTGRPRLVLFGVRIPGGLLFLAPFVVAALALGWAAATVFAGYYEPPSAGTIASYAGWIAAGAVYAFALAVGLGSLMSGRVATGILLGWQLAASPILLGTGKLDPVLPAAALERLQPHGGEATLSLGMAFALLGAWTAVALAVGAWRTVTRDA